MKRKQTGGYYVSPTVAWYREEEGQGGQERAAGARPRQWCIFVGANHFTANC